MKVKEKIFKKVYKTLIKERKEEFSNISKEELIKKVEETIKGLRKWGWWKIEEEIKENGKSWVVLVPNTFMILPGNPILIFHFLSRSFPAMKKLFRFFYEKGIFSAINVKALLVDVSDKTVIARCHEGFNIIYVDWQKERIKIIDEFFINFKSIIEKKTVNDLLMKKYANYRFFLRWVLAMVIFFLGLLFFIEYLPRFIEFILDKV